MLWQLLLVLVAATLLLLSTATKLNSLYVRLHSVLSTHACKTQPKG
jgi:hypothetical protein